MLRFRRTGLAEGSLSYQPSL
uniref:Uncharacterized protein n=1 Tax=Arundo donax TaxID=35708 RepID=A0A0A9GEB0_ARUDO